MWVAGVLFSTVAKYFSNYEKSKRCFENTQPKKTKTLPNLQKSKMSLFCFCCSYLTQKKCRIYVAFFPTPPKKKMGFLTVSNFKNQILLPPRFPQPRPTSRTMATTHGPSMSWGPGCFPQNKVLNIQKCCHAQKHATMKPPKDPNFMELEFQGKLVKYEKFANKHRVFV